MRSWKRRFNVSAGWSPQTPDDHVEDRGQEEPHEGHAEHPTENHGAQNLSHLGTCAGGQREGRDPKNKGERGHQNRAEPELRGFRRGRSWIQSGIFTLLRELHDKNGVLAGEPDQHHKADLGQDVDLHLSQTQCHEGEQQHQRNNEHNGEGQRPTLVLGRQNEKDEQHRQRKNEESEPASTALLVGELGPFKAEAGR